MKARKHGRVEKVSKGYGDRWRPRGGWELAAILFVWCHLWSFRGCFYSKGQRLRTIKTYDAGPSV